MSVRNIRVVCVILGTTLLALVVMGEFVQQAQASLILGKAKNYGVLTDPRIHSAQSSDSTFVGNWGICSPDGTTSPPFQFSSGTITGNVNFAGPVNITAGGTVNGTTNAYVAAVTSAYNTITALSSTLGGETGTPFSLTGSPQTVNASSGTLDPNGNRIFRVGFGDFSIQDPLTINGLASDYVVFNIPSGVKAEFKADVSLTGGITEDHVLFNVLGTGNEIKSGGDSTIHGIIVGVNRKFNMDSATVEGRIFGGGNNQDFQLVSNFHLNSPVPEPATLAFLGLGLAGMVIRRRKK